MYEILFRFGLKLRGNIGAKWNKSMIYANGRHEKINSIKIIIRIFSNFYFVVMENILIINVYSHIYYVFQHYKLEEILINNCEQKKKNKSISN